ncbi:MAG: Nif3-like dinuclear metal center hexameric protein [Firmicutes bacterium]|nr:Nif3-like dinuclear metal center hexameric protein [Bacillota bacterium]MBQ9603790.1 Nif3-like dinuclear metal center hexameric protein [Bacillota bacterium]
MSVKEIIALMEQLAPADLAESWDNVGLLVGDKNAEVKKILFALDATDEVIAEAIEIGADMIITHHPLIFKGVNAVNTDTALGRRIIKLIKNNISVYSAHTNFDIAEGGTNSTLAQLIVLENSEGLIPAGESFLGKVGDLPHPMSLKDLSSLIMDKLNAPALNITGAEDKIIKRVGLCTGSGADRSFMLAAKSKGCDVYITGDVKYHDAQFAADLDIALIDATHYYTEAAAIPRLCDYISQKCAAECVVTRINGESFKTITR